MKLKLLSVLFILGILFPVFTVNAQDIEVIRGDSVIYGTPGVTELVIYAHVVNISAVDQTVFLVRTEEALPANWLSELCFDVNCYPPNVDSVVTTEAFHPGDTVEISVHFLPDQSVAGTGHVQIQIGTMHNPNDRTIMNLTASTEPSAVNDQINSLNEFRLMQNYPNPFNPSTTISYNIAKRANVSLKIYNITGKEVATLVNGEKEPGSYRVNFNAEKLSSGIYFYKISAGNFSSVRKMILIK